MYNKELYYNNDLVISVVLKYVFECCFYEVKKLILKEKGMWKDSVLVLGF